MPKTLFSPEQIAQYSATAPPDQGPNQDYGPNQKPSTGNNWYRGGQAALIGSNAADIGSTMSALQNPNLRESNPILGDNPSAARLIGTKALGVAAQMYLMHRLAKNHPKMAGIAGLAGSAVPAFAAINNMRLAR